MASPNNPPSSRELILRHSKARVLRPSAKRFVTGHDPITGRPTFSRQLTDQDVREQLARQFA